MKKRNSWAVLLALALTSGVMLTNRFITPVPDGLATPLMIVAAVLLGYYLIAGRKNERK